MGSFLKDNEDLRFYLDKWLDWAPLARITELDFTEPEGFKNSEEAVAFYKEVLGTIAEFVADEVAPLGPEIDREHLRLENGEVVLPPQLKKIDDAMRGLDLHGMCLPRALGGLNCPAILFSIVGELFARADVSVGAHFGFHGGMAMAMLMYSVYEGTTKFDPQTGQITETRFRELIEEIAAGKAWGCMDITEPHAGSDMAQLKTKGEQDEAGNWFVTGEKIFITSGHGKYHFVIARTEDAKPGTDMLAGLKGLSLFLVPTYADLPGGGRKRLATMDRIEEKLGHHGSVTATVKFERTPAYLIGKRGDGFKHMLLLMNSARIGVGFEALGLAEAAYRLAASYAAERVSMGKPIAQHELIADYLDEMRTDIQGLRALAMGAAYAEEMSRKSELALQWGGDKLANGERLELQRNVRKFRKKSRFMTPLLKYLGAEKTVEIARRGLQIHGGFGYMQDYGAEKILRDALVVPIYEGTSQIQALMAMKDNLVETIKNPQDFVRAMGQMRWRAYAGRDALDRRVAKLELLALNAKQHLVLRTAKDKLVSVSHKPITEWTAAFFNGWDPKRDFAFGLLHAERLTRILADVAVCRELLEQQEKFPERRELLERYLERAEPRCRWLYEEITTTGDRLLERLSKEQQPAMKAAS
ncbi:MAG: acyl-CoA dehydrogenase family protein [Candidatus Schekmanbacteria bacterium]|nr:acyl-CoA dehydrogenase family protein [Candidatus Schekmanbacteria bacterium]